MSKVDEYRQELKTLASWDEYLLEESRLPSPRANLELAFAVALEGSEDQITRYAQLNAEDAPGNTQEEFLAFCGVLGLGYLMARGIGEHFVTLREKANDPRWRIREAVALGLQKYGQAMSADLLEKMDDWARGSLLERRAVVATLCEPGLLEDYAHASNIIDIIDAITTSILEEEDRKAEDFKVLRKALAYGWSVLVVGQPSIGKPRMEAWIGSQDPDIRWIMKQNLKKKRLSRMDKNWVRDQLEALG
jgi:hypothetical protein